MSTRDEKLAFAKTMVVKLRNKIEDAVGVASVTTDGISVTYVNNLQGELERWEKQVERYSRSKSRTSTIDVSNSHD